MNSFSKYIFIFYYCFIILRAKAAKFTHKTAANNAIPINLNVFICFIFN